MENNIVLNKVQIHKMYNDVILPKKGTDGSSGLDIFAYTSDPIDIRPGRTRIIPTGITVTIPRGYEIQIRSRSGLAFKYNVFVLNSPGTIDSDYTGEIKIMLTNLGEYTYEVCNGTRIAQMVIMRVHTDDLYEADIISNEPRGSSGFGSTDK